jgi:N-acetylglucosamine-6-phosphate deacetylase
VSRSRPIAIEAGTLLTPTERWSPGRVILDGPSIAEAGGRDIRVPAGAQTVDASHLIVTPGFIDPHIHGAGGVDVMDGTHESLNAVSRIIARHGTTSFLATTVSSPIGVLTNAVEKLALLAGKPFDGAQPLGIHLEGPFISTTKRGTHRVENIAVPDPEVLRKWIRLSGSSIRLLTVAPELDGVDDVIGLAGDSGIVLAMGHSDATFEQARTAAGRGVCYAVHTFNAMREFSHRDP